MTPAKNSPATVADPTDEQASVDLVRLFLDNLAAGDSAALLAVVADDIVYNNVSLPTIRGKRRFTQFAKGFATSRVGFEVRIHRIAERDGSVLTERTDALVLGPFRMQFWVCGVFEVRDGRIQLWRDYFDYQTTPVAVLRGLVGVVVPALRPRFRD
jgi:limonene-1,2-epoxide hydrolase